ncbi:MAG: DUF2993 domain-containing protein, partial [Micromonosporaceae bacterium]|nr:DUF2993 domain-containing protein [Micromonosporaceae bacterium]
VAEGRIASQVKTELVSRSITTAGQPTVTIAGFPFLTQVMTGEYDKISVGIVAAEAGGVRFDAIDLDIRRVKADLQQIMNGSGTVTAGEITGEAVMGWDAARQALEVSGLPQVDLSAVELSVVEGAVRLRVPLTVSGQSVAFTATGVLQAQQGAVKLKITNVTAEGVPASAAVQRKVDQYRKALVVEVDVPPMPYGLAIKSVQTDQSGISVITQASDVVLAG